MDFWLFLMLLLCLVALYMMIRREVPFILAAVRLAVELAVAGLFFVLPVYYAMNNWSDIALVVVSITGFLVAAIVGKLANMFFGFTVLGGKVETLEEIIKKVHSEKMEDVKVIELDMDTLSVDEVLSIMESELQQEKERRGMSTQEDQ